MALSIRNALLDDAEGIARVDIASHLAAYRHIFGESYLAGVLFETFIERWQRLIRGDPGNPQVPQHAVVATEGEEVIGYVCFGPSRDEDAADTGEIGAIYVHPDRWRSGTGRALMAHALQALRERGFAEVTLWALEDNAIGRRFYDTEGWHLDGAARTPQSHGRREVRYRKRADQQPRPE